MLIDLFGNITNVVFLCSCRYYANGKLGQVGSVCSGASVASSVCSDETGIEGEFEDSLFASEQLGPLLTSLSGGGVTGMSALYTLCTTSFVINDTLETIHNVSLFYDTKYLKVFFSQSDVFTDFAKFDDFGYYSELRILNILLLLSVEALPEAGMWGDNTLEPTGVNPLLDLDCDIMTSMASPSHPSRKRSISESSCELTSKPWYV